MEQALAVDLELLQLEQALLSVDAVLSADARVARAVRKRARLAAQALVALDLQVLELLLLKALIEVELIEPARVGGREIVAPGTQALLEIQIQRVLLLAQLKLAARALGVRVERND